MGITPKSPADFDPSMGNYKDLRPFRFWCQKVLPLVYDDSLSYYEVLCKLVDYLNKTMEDVGVLHDDVDALHTAYQQLQAYVNDYFSTLDVQQEINNKLDVMASDGTLDALLLPYFNAYKTEINQIVATQNSDIDVLEARMDTFARLAEGSTTGDAELEDIRVGADGTTYSTAGDAVRAQVRNLTNVLNANLVNINLAEKDKYYDAFGYKHASSGGIYYVYPQFSLAAGKYYYYVSKSGEPSIYNGGVSLDFTYIRTGETVVRLIDIADTDTQTFTLSDNSDICVTGYMYGGTHRPYAYISKEPIMQKEIDSLIMLTEYLDDSSMKIKYVNDATVITDFNNADKNTAYIVFGQYSIANSPFQDYNAGTIVINYLSADEHIRNQFAMQPSRGLFYYRTGYDNNFSPWGNIVGGGEPMKIKYVNNQTVLTDFNNAEKNTTYIVFGQYHFDHSPFDDYMAGTIFINYLSADEHIRNQFAMQPSRGLFYYRTGYDDGFAQWVNMKERQIITVLDEGNLYTALQTAYTQGNTEVYVYGEHDLYEEMGGGEYFDVYDFVDEPWGAGCLLGMNNSYHFAKNSLVTFNYEGENEDVLRDFSPLNAGDGDYLLEGLNIETSNCRYSVHDELGVSYINHNKCYSHHYKNCSMKHDNSNNSVFTNKACIGGGLETLVGCKILIEGCTFEGYGDSGKSVSYHNGGGSNTQSIIVVRDCEFITDGFYLQPYGTSQKITKCFMMNNVLKEFPSLLQSTSYPANVQYVLGDNIIMTTTNPTVNATYGTGTITAEKCGYYCHIYGEVELTSDFPSTAGTPLITNVPAPKRATEVYIENDQHIPTYRFRIRTGDNDVVTWYTTAIPSGSTVYIDFIYEV